MESLLGRMGRFAVRRIEGDVAWLAARSGARDARSALVPMPASELPEGAKTGSALDAFVYLDSEDRPIATTRTPKIALGEIDFLTVVSTAPFGAFVNWGLKKDLLVPHREQVRSMRVGERHAIGLYIDDTGRLAGTARISEMLKPPPERPADEWINGVAWRDEAGLGLFVILEKHYLALLPSTEPHRLYPGDEARFRITHVHPDGKVEVSLRGLKHEELEADAAHLLEVLRAPRAPRLGDATSPERIRAVLGISKKAFKRAAGRLLKMQAAEIDDAGFLRARRG
jgi:predicted RNA-binding protein (virulence factor B family)